MKVGEAKKIYGAQLRDLWNKKLELINQKKQLEKKTNAVPGGKELFAEEAATLELSLEAVSKKYEENRKFMDKVSETYVAAFNAEVSRQQSDVMEEYAEDLAKVNEVARRIADGGIVPPTDEQKLMEYSMEMYMAAKNMALLNELKEKEEYESLWGEEEEPAEYDPEGAGNNAEVTVEAPELIEVPAAAETAETE